MIICVQTMCLHILHRRWMNLWKNISGVYGLLFLALNSLFMYLTGTISRFVVVPSVFKVVLLEQSVKGPCKVEWFSIEWLGPSHFYFMNPFIMCLNLFPLSMIGWLRRWDTMHWNLIISVCRVDQLPYDLCPGFGIKTLLTFWFS